MRQRPPVLDGLNLVVADMQASIEFYRRLGLEIPDESVWGTKSGAHHVEVKMANGFSLDLDSAALAESYNTGWRGAEPAGRAVVSFRVPERDDVDKRFAELVAAGHRGLQEPYDTFWGSRYAIVADPDGREVGIMSPADPARRGRPPEL